MKEDDIENKIYFSKYLTNKKIGEGSFGKIYKARDIFEKKDYAMKFVQIKY